MQENYLTLEKMFILSKILQKKNARTYSPQGQECIIQDRHNHEEDVVQELTEPPPPASAPPLKDPIPSPDL